MTEPTNIVMFPGNDPLVVALDVSSSMLAYEPALNASRFEAARATLSDVIKRLPRDTPVTVLTFGDELNVLARDVSSVQARACLMVAQANRGGTKTGFVLEWLFTRYMQHSSGASARLGHARANLLVVTDGTPDDLPRWEAWSDYNAKYGNPVCVTVLTCGDAVEMAHAMIPAASHGTAMRAPLHDVEIRLSVPTGSDRPDSERRPTVPPSLSPPDRDDTTLNLPAERAALRARHAAEATQIAASDPDREPPA